MCSRTNVKSDGYQVAVRSPSVVRLNYWVPELSGIRISSLVEAQFDFRAVKILDLGCISTVVTVAERKIIEC